MWDVRGEVRVDALVWLGFVWGGGLALRRRPWGGLTIEVAGCAGTGARGACAAVKVGAAGERPERTEVSLSVSVLLRLREVVRPRRVVRLLKVLRPRLPGIVRLRGVVKPRGPFRLQPAVRLWLPCGRVCLRGGLRVR